MLMKVKVAVIYGGAGAVGRAVATAFAREGAEVSSPAHPVEVADVAEQIAGFGGNAVAAEVDVLDEEAIERHLDRVVEGAGRLDVSFNAFGIPQEGVQGIPLTDLTLESFMGPVLTYARAHFLTARAAARRMLAGRAGVILMHTPQPAALGAPLAGGMAPAWVAMEALSRDLSAELASQGVRSIVIRTTGLPETETIETVFGLLSRPLGITSEQFQQLVESSTHLRRSSTLSELADAAVFAASDLNTAMTGAIINLTGGAVVD
jgi:NAD(P)-dependent dehydrogenase (short-subunit alcohol dehydrogenase family)